MNYSTPKARVTACPENQPSLSQLWNTKYSTRHLSPVIEIKAGNTWQLPIIVQLGNHSNGGFLCQNPAQVMTCGVHNLPRFLKRSSSDDDDDDDDEDFYGDQVYAGVQDKNCRLHFSSAVFTVMSSVSLLSLQLFMLEDETAVEERHPSAYMLTQLR